jgi:hypothetical protein
MQSERQPLMSRRWWSAFLLMGQFCACSAANEMRGVEGPPADVDAEPPVFSEAETPILTDSLTVLAASSESASGTPGPPSFVSGYFSRIGDLNDLDALAARGINVVLPYVGTQDVSVIRPYLDKAHQLGISVYLQVYDTVHDGRGGLVPVNPTRVTTVVSTFHAHPAVIGWNIADEPIHDAVLHSIPFEEVTEALRTVHGLVRAADPTGKPLLGIIYRYDDPRAGLLIRDFFDVWAYDRYPFDEARPQQFDEYDYGVRVTRKLADLVRFRGKPFIMIGQAHGRQPDEPWKLRLPTRAEHLWQMTYPLVATAKTGLYRGHVHWAYYRTLTSVARPGFAFPRDGVAWLSEVFDPVQRPILGLLAASQGSWRIDLSDPLDESGASGIEAHVFQHAERGVFLVAVNHAASPVSRTFDLSGLGYDVGYVNDLVSPERRWAIRGRTISQTLPSREPVILNIRLTPLINRSAESTEVWAPYGGAQISLSSARNSGQSSLEVHTRQNAASGAQQDITRYVSAFGPGRYRFGSTMAGEGFGRVFVEYRGTLDSEVRYASVSTEVGAQFEPVGGDAVLAWTGDLAFARIKLKTDGLRSFRFDDVYFWKL